MTLFVTSAAPPNVTFLPQNPPSHLRPTERGRRHEEIFWVATGVIVVAVFAATLLQA